MRHPVLAEDSTERPTPLGDRYRSSAPGLRDGNPHVRERLTERPSPLPIPDDGTRTLDSETSKLFMARDFLR